MLGLSEQLLSAYNPLHNPSVHVMLHFIIIDCMNCRDEGSADEAQENMEKTSSESGDSLLESLELRSDRISARHTRCALRCLVGPSLLF